MNRDPDSHGPTITGIVGRGFRVDGGIYEGLLITPRSAEGWTPPPLDALTPDALGPVLDMSPRAEFLLLGTGSAMRRPPSALIAALEARGIGVEPMDSRAAARAWAVLRAEERWIAGALYPLDEAAR